ncbi:MAG: YciI family protein [Gemmatimonadetes bacterium]|nr:YciI family protein [Candidatus Palauibacter australiensis]
MYVAAFITDKSGAAQARDEMRASFMEYLRSHPAHPDVVVHHGGPTLGDDGESIVGRLIVMEAPSVEAASAFLADSPFARANVFAECHVHAWDWTTGRPR